MDDLLGDLLREYGVVGLIGFLVAFGAFYFIRSRAKTTEANAAEKTADATAVSALSNATTKLLEHLPTILVAITETQRATNETQRVLTVAVAEILASQKTSAASGASIATQMEAATVALDAAQAAILADIKTLITNLSLLTAAIEKQDIVDDGLRADMLSRISRLEEFLKRKEEKEKQDEQAEPQNTVALTGSVTVLPNPESLSGSADG